MPEMKPTTLEQILRLAEEQIRHSGYHPLSFRELAKEIGIKSSSVHYYFPTKADLGAAVAKAYTTSFFEALQEQVNQGASAFEAYLELFERAAQTEKMCLCGMLGVESPGLPDKVTQEARIFFEKSLNWLSGALGSKARALQTLAQLEGALLLSQMFTDPILFEQAIANLRSE